MNRRVALKKEIWVIVLTLLLLISVQSTLVKAEDLPNSESDIVFLLDISGSMKSTDAAREVLHMLQIAVDLCNENDRIALIAYNDTIAYTYDFVTVSDAGKVNEYKEFLSQIQYFGETDIGLGLSTATNYLVQHSRKDANRYIIMLSDGETDLGNSSSGRTEEDSERDVNDSLKKCTEYEIKLHTIGFIKTFSDRLDYLSLLSDSTGGMSNVATSPFLLLESICNIMLQYKDGNMERMASYISVNAEERIMVPLSEGEKKSYIMIIYSSGPLNEITVASKKNNPNINREHNYAVIILDEPKPENIVLTLHNEIGSNVIINGIEYYVKQSPPTYAGDCDVKKTVTKNKITDLIFTIKDENTGEVIKRRDFYEKVTADITITNISTTDRVRIQGTVDENGILAKHVFNDIGTYEIHVEFKLGELKGECVSVTEVVNIPPIARSILDDTLCISREFTTYDVEKLFENQDNDVITYEVFDKKDNYVDVFISGDKLFVRPVAYGDSIFSVKAIDSDGGSAIAKVHIYSIPFWKYHFGLTVGLVALGIIFVSILIIGLIILLFHKDKILRKHCFRGVITGNFINLKSKNDIGDMSWDLSKFTGRSISLGNLFEAANIHENLPELENIIFYPRKQGELLIAHESENSVFINTQNLMQKKVGILSDGDTIYIGFYGNSIELELKYISEY